MTEAQKPLATDEPGDDADPVDASWRALLPRLKALIPRRKVTEKALEIGGITPSYLHALIRGEKKNPTLNMRRRIEAWVEEQERIREIVQRGTKLVDKETSAVETTPRPTSPPVTQPAYRSEDRLPSPSHAAMMELLSRLPESVVLEMIPEVAKKVAQHLPAKPEPKKD